MTRANLPLWNQPDDEPPKGKAHRNAPQTSHDAAQEIARPAVNQRERILAFIRDRGRRGATDEQIEDQLHISGNSVRPRRQELQEAGLIRLDHGVTRATRSGRSAVVYIAVREADRPLIAVGAKAIGRTLAQLATSSPPKETTDDHAND